MTRKEKIQLLKCIQQGKVSIESLKPPGYYEVIQNTERSPVYIHGEMEMNFSEYQEFRQRKLQANPTNVVWLETRNNSTIQK